MLVFIVCLLVILPSVEAQTDSPDVLAIVTVTEWQYAKMACTIKDSLDDKVIWFGPSSAYPLSIGNNVYSSDKRFGVESRTLDLFIKAVRLSDSGKYKCATFTSPKGPYHYVFLNVTEKGVMDKTPVNVTVSEGSSARLPCSVDPGYTDQPEHKVIWVDPDGSFITTNEESMVKDDQRFFLNRPTPEEWNLVIHTVSLRNAGRYRCMLSHSPSFRWVYLKVTLNGPGERGDDHDDVDGRVFGPSERVKNHTFPVEAASLALRVADSAATVAASLVVFVLALFLS